MQEGKCFPGTVADKPRAKAEITLKFWRLPPLPYLSYLSYQGLGVTEHMVLQKLMEHVEQVVLNKGFDDQLIQVVL